jgi:hypothetical protein
MVSSFHTKEQYSLFLQTAKDAIERLAKGIVNGSITPQHLTNLDELRQRCEDIVADESVPSHAMIDAAEAEANAFKAVFPGLAIRVCQFHLMQACKWRLRALFPGDNAVDYKSMTASKRSERPSVVRTKPNGIDARRSWVVRSRT